MENNDNSGAVDKIAKLARTAAGVKSIGKKDRLIAVPDGVSLVSEDVVLHPGLAKTVSIDRTEQVGDPQAFVEFMESFGTKESVVFIDGNLGKACAIINYIPKQTFGLPNKETIMGYRCDWQILYEHSFSKEWKLINAIVNPKLSAAKMRFSLIAIKDFFYELDDTVHELSYRDSNKKTLYSQIFNAHIATEDDMLALTLNKTPAHKRMIANFAIPVHRGCNAMEIAVFIEHISGKAKLSILDADSIVTDSNQIGMSRIRTKLRNTFKVFETDLSN